MFFENVDSQYIDTNGKCRILNFKNISLAVSPLPPFDKKEVSKQFLKMASLARATEFIKSTNLYITEKDVDETLNTVNGLWVKSKNNPPEIAFGYIPLKNGIINENDNIPTTHETIVNPIFVENTSQMSTFANNRKIALFLREYAIYEWTKNIDAFGLDNFMIEPNFYYDMALLNFELPPTPINPFYQLDDLNVNKLVVPDEDTAKRLITLVLTLSVRDSFFYENSLNKKSVDTSLFFTQLNDFRREKDQLIFLDKSSLSEWKKRKLDFVDDPSQIVLENSDKTYISGALFSQNSEPYYYRNFRIEDGKLSILQNTQGGDLFSALAVSKEWETYKVNPGYEPKNIVVPENPSFEVYTDVGLTHQSLAINELSNEEIIYKVFGYDDGSYAAILFL